MLIEFRYSNTVLVMTSVFILELLMILKKPPVSTKGTVSFRWFVSVFVGATYLNGSEYSK